MVHAREADPVGALVSFDLETTGLSPRSDRVIEVGAVRFTPDGRVIDELSLLVDPSLPIPLAIQRLTGITDADVRGQPSPTEAIAQLADFVGDAELVGHGVAFDLAFCSALAPSVFGGRAVYDTLELARILLPVAPSHSLPLLSGELDLLHERPHRAHSDADATRRLFTHLVTVARGLPGAVLSECRRVAGQGEGPLRRFFLAMVDGDGEAGEGLPAPTLRAPIRHRPPPVDDRLPLADRVAEVFRPGGHLERIRPGYALRESQAQMAAAVAQTLERRRRLIVEAGTGVGKSLGYLVPLALWLRRTGKRGVVATHTITLQEQLAAAEVPLVDALLGTPLNAAVLKGRHHYISLRRWRRFLRQSDDDGHRVDPDRVRFKLKVLCWLAATRTGDRAELRLTAPEEALWHRVESDAGDCLGPSCRNWATGACFMAAARRRAADAELVITNHALLLADAERQGTVLEAFDGLVVDEAHHLENAATQQLGHNLRYSDVALSVDRVPLQAGGPVATAVDEAGHAALRLFGDIKGYVGSILGGDNPGNGTVGITDELRDDAGFRVLSRAAGHTAALLHCASAALRDPAAAAEVDGFALAEPGSEGEELAVAASAMGDIATAIERVLVRPRDGHVCWLEVRAEQGELHEAPVTVAEAIDQRVFARADAAVVTSATLSVAGSFAFVRQRIGVGHSAADLRLESPFDYMAQALSVIPMAMPPYDAPEYDAALAEIVADCAIRLSGRILVLFTGYSPLRRVHALLGDRLETRGIALLGQGIDGTRRQILRSFIGNPRTALLGTSSFWEGIDLPGDLLRCVVVAKLPFAVPSDPLVRARSDQLQDPFGDYILPMAVLRLKQGFGRLIRTESDRGAVVLCDQRLESRDYGPRFLQALPPAAIARVSPREVGGVVAAFVRGEGVPAGASIPVPPRGAAGYDAWPPPNDEEPA